ncbi:tISRso5 ISRSO5-transposase protein [mine drainage metagenome]|uniref:TISRso5 ISRSO5-transposase protein n=1 Tax=mine drainage metagenome TaxID=410659 RepID=T1CWB2_9ZZZZ
MIRDIASELHTRPNTVIQWRDRYLRNGLKGLYDEPRSGKPKKYPADLKIRIVKLIETDPPAGHAVWNGPLIAHKLGVSDDTIWKILRDEGIQLQRHRSWCVSTDPEFTSKSVDVIGLYMDPPDNAMVISVDEKPGMQTLERPTGYVKTRSKRIVKALKSTYRRNGTLNLFAALNVMTGIVNSKTTKTKKRVDFLVFMDEVLRDLPDKNAKDQEVKEIHVILDNYCTHKRCDEWLSKHPNVKFHYTPTSASWLNMVEIFFSILSRETLRGASFRSTDALPEAVMAFVNEHNSKAKPFIWKKGRSRVLN